MPYTLAEAAKATGTNKTTILRAIKSGKISGTKNDQGEWHVEPVELHRVYPPTEARSGAQRGGSDAAQQYASPDAAAIAEANHRAALAEERLSQLKAMLDDVRQDRDAWRDQAQAVIRQLAAPVTTPAPAARSWWRRMAG